MSALPRKVTTSSVAHGRAVAAPPVTSKKARPEAEPVTLTPIERARYDGMMEAAEMLMRPSRMLQGRIKPVILLDPSGTQSVLTERVNAIKQAAGMGGPTTKQVIDAAVDVLTAWMNGKVTLHDQGTITSFHDLEHIVRAVDRRAL